MNAEARSIWALRFTTRPSKSRCPLSYADYKRYLRSGHWRRLRARIRTQREERCEVCRERRTPAKRLVLEVHHKTYERLGAERDSDLQLLCQACHADAHVAWDPF